MSERARIASWWGYVGLVIVIFEVMMARSNFAYAVAVTLAAIVVLGGALKLAVWALSRRSRRPVR